MGTASAIELGAGDSHSLVRLSQELVVRHLLAEQHRASGSSHGSSAPKTPRASWQAVVTSLGAAAAGHSMVRS
jgi:hypothetical protein